MKNSFAFTRINFILLAVSMAIVILGYILMSGSGSSPEKFEPAIFDTRHIGVAPFVCFVGYILMVFAILYSPKQKEEANVTETPEAEA